METDLVHYSACIQLLPHCFSINGKKTQPHATQSNYYLEY